MKTLQITIIKIMKYINKPWSLFCSMILVVRGLLMKWDPVHLNSSSRTVKYINNVKATWAALLPCSTSDFPFSTNPARVYNGMS